MNNDANQPASDATEQRLTKALNRLPDVAVPSNFTARVMAAIELEEANASRPVHGWNRFAWLPRFAIATATVAIAIVAFQQHESSARRTDLAQSVAAVAAGPMPSVDALKNFDAIQRINQPQHADEELLALLQ